jgi:hypothetical protein
VVVKTREIANKNEAVQGSQDGRTPAVPRNGAESDPNALIVQDLPKTPEIRINRVQEYTRQRAVRRRAMAKRFRKQVTRALAAIGGTSAPDFARAAMIDVAVSAFVEHSELTVRFLSGRALNREMLRLHSVRSQLTRALVALGLAGSVQETVPGAIAPPKGASAEEKREWAKKYVSDALASTAAGGQ